MREIPTTSELFDYLRRSGLDLAAADVAAWNEPVRIEVMAWLDAMPVALTIAIGERESRRWSTALRRWFGRDGQT